LIFNLFMIKNKFKLKKNFLKNIKIEFLKNKEYYKYFLLKKKNIYENQLELLIY
jgi:hypothetical protein